MNLFVYLPKYRTLNLVFYDWIFSPILYHLLFFTEICSSCILKLQFVVTWCTTEVLFCSFFWSLLMQYRCWLGSEYSPVFPLLLFFLLDQRMQKGLAELQICFPGGSGLCAGFTRCLVAMQVCQVWCYGLPMLMFIQEGPLLPEQREGASQLWKHC